MSEVTTQLGCRSECPYRKAADTAIAILEENLGNRFDEETRGKRLGELVLMTEVFNKVHVDCAGPVDESGRSKCVSNGFINDVMSLITHESNMSIHIPSFDTDDKKKD